MGEAEVERRIGLERSDLPLELVGRVPIVLVEERDQLAVGGGDPAVSGAATPARACLRRCTPGYAPAIAALASVEPSSTTTISKARHR